MVIRLGASAGEDNFLRTRANQRRDLFAGGFNSGASALAGGVDGGGVAEIGGEIGKHRVEHRRFDGCGGVVVEVDSHGPPTDRITGGSGGWEDARVQETGCGAADGRVSLATAKAPRMPFKNPIKITVPSMPAPRKDPVYTIM